MGTRSLQFRDEDALAKVCTEKPEKRGELQNQRRDIKWYCLMEYWVPYG
jgi:hypothetical protein